MFLHMYACTRSMRSLVYRFYGKKIAVKEWFFPFGYLAIQCTITANMEIFNWFVLLSYLEGPKPSSVHQISLFYEAAHFLFRLRQLLMSKLFTHFHNQGLRKVKFWGNFCSSSLDPPFKGWNYFNNINECMSQF